MNRAQEIPPLEGHRAQVRGCECGHASTPCPAKAAQIDAAYYAAGYPRPSITGAPILDPDPWVTKGTRGLGRSQEHWDGPATFDPRPGYSQNREDYPA